MGKFNSAITASTKNEKTTTTRKQQPKPPTDPKKLDAAIKKVIKGL